MRTGTWEGKRCTWQAGRLLERPLNKPATGSPGKSRMKLTNVVRVMIIGDLDEDRSASFFLLNDDWKAVRYLRAPEDSLPKKPRLVEQETGSDFLVMSVTETLKRDSLAKAIHAIETRLWGIIDEPFEPPWHTGFVDSDGDVEVHYTLDPGDGLCSNLLGSKLCEPLADFIAASPDDIHLLLEVCRALLNGGLPDVPDWWVKAEEERKAEG